MTRNLDKLKHRTEISPIVIPFALVIMLVSGITLLAYDYNNFDTKTATKASQNVVLGTEDNKLTITPTLTPSITPSRQ
jgi:hypothetical protein